MISVSKICLSIFAIFLWMSVPTFAAYLLQPKDTLDIHIVGHDELNTKQAITPDGSISLPLLGRLFVQDQTMSQLDVTLQTGFSKFIKLPQVTAILIPNSEGKNKADLPIFVVVHDLKKDSVEVKSTKSVSEAYSWVSGRAFQIFRDGKVTQNVEILPGDSLVVGYSKAPDFFEENWYKLLTAAGVVTGIWLGLHR